MSIDLTRREFLAAVAAAQGAFVLGFWVPDKVQAQTPVAKPSGAGPFPGVVVSSEAFGVTGHITDVCDRRGARGYVALAPEIAVLTELPCAAVLAGLALYAAWRVRPRATAETRTTRSNARSGGSSPRR